ncbi:DUF6232 family protein [Mesorhizobium sp. J428]|uniref:DUF6232 family protein n=1 Tax=Mesorhizobium sp. J428 TaxID=2898440 RepID=UPI002151AC8B|nr:DUF6232 family protein [Mesorhizobium sp. J428]MCR5858267.1 DUF6232 family protein [Mesorhizobium sp. J428]
MEPLVYFRGGGFEVTDRLLRTPRKSYAIDRIEYVSVGRPLLFFAGLPATGLIGFALVFRRYLLASEIVTLTGVSIAAIGLALLFGTLRVHSLALRDDEVAMNFGPLSRLRQVRTAVEQAIVARHGDKRASQEPVAS